FASRTYTLKHPRPGWAEQDPDEWWTSLVAAVRDVISKSGIVPDEIAGKETVLPIPTQKHAG
ncbi:MAG: xylulose kinase, partial [Chloroflexi bacterium]